jgi:hypothetical protein
MASSILRDVKEQAEALRVGLLAGYVGPNEVVTWADNLIVATDVPEPEIIAVSLVGSCSANDVARALAAIPGVGCREKVAELVLRQMAKAIQRDPKAARSIARMLFQMYQDGIIPSEQAGLQMSRLDDAFDLAESGTWGTPEEVLAELVEFLAAWAGDPA